MFKMPTFCHSTLPTTTSSVDKSRDLRLPFLSSQNSMDTGFLDANLTRTLPQWLLWGSCRNLHDCVITLVISGTSLTDLSTHLAALHRLQTCLGFLLLLPLVVVVVLVCQIQPANVIELQHSSLSNNTYSNHLRSSNDTFTAMFV